MHSPLAAVVLPRPMVRVSRRKSAWTRDGARGLLVCPFSRVCRPLSHALFAPLGNSWLFAGATIATCARYCATVLCPWSAATADSITSSHHGSKQHLLGTTRTWRWSGTAACPVVRRWRCLLGSHCRSDENAASTVGAAIPPVECACCACAALACATIAHRSHYSVYSACRGCGCGFPLMPAATVVLPMLTPLPLPTESYVLRPVSLVELLLPTDLPCAWLQLWLVIRYRHWQFRDGCGS